jgi:hypothetical protein
MKKILYPVLSLILIGAGCSRQSAVEAQGEPGGNQQQGTPPRLGYAQAGGERQYAGAESPVSYAEPAESGGWARTGYAGEIASGTVVHVRLNETLDTKRNRAGDQFGATLDEPLLAGDRVIVPKGTRFKGHVVQARPSGRFKGRATMALSLDAFELGGVTYPLETSRAARASRGHKKRNWLWIGGGSGSGAAIGAIAGGGAGALIGAGAGAAAGTAGAAITGKRNVALPVETRLAFTLRSAVNLRNHP